MFSDRCHNRGQKDARASRVSAEGKYVTDTQQRRRRTEERQFATCTSATRSAKGLAGKTSMLSLLITSACIFFFDQRKTNKQKNPKISVKQKRTFAGQT